MKYWVGTPVAHARTRGTFLTDTRMGDLRAEFPHRTSILSPFSFADEGLHGYRQGIMTCPVYVLARLLGVILVNNPLPIRIPPVFMPAALLSDSYPRPYPGTMDWVLCLGVCGWMSSSRNSVVDRRCLATRPGTRSLPSSTPWRMQRTERGRTR